jgi:putative DNA primase/helicase
MQDVSWLLPPRLDGKSVHQRKINKKANYFYIFPKRENASEAGEAGEAHPSKPISDKTIE